MATAFVATIGLVDQATGPLARVAATIAGIGKQINGTGAHLVPMSGMSAAHNALSAVGKAFGGIRDTAGQAISAVSQFASVLGTVGVTASVTGLVMLTKSVADSQRELSNASAKLGVLPQQLESLRGAARVAGLDVGMFEGGMVRLNVAMAKVTSGKSKDLTNLFSHISLSAAQLKGMTIPQMLPLLADAFAKTTDPAMKLYVASQLFGRAAGPELVPLLSQGSGAIADLMKAVEGLDYRETLLDKVNREKFSVGWVRMQIAIEGTKNAIGARLMPVMQPIIDSMTAWLTVNREWLATKITDEVKGLVTFVKELWVAFKAIDWSHPVGGAWDFAGAIWAATGNTTGAHMAITALGITLGAPLLSALASTATMLYFVAKAVWAVSVALYANPIVALIAGIALAFAIAAYEIYKNWDAVGPYFWKMWDGIKAAFNWGWNGVKPIFEAVSAAAKWMGDKLGLDPGLALGGAVPVPQIAGLPTSATGTGEAYGPTMPRAAPTLPPELLRLVNGTGGYQAPLGEGPGASGGGPAAAPQTGKVDVTVKFENAPPGTTGTATASGIARVAPLDVGHAWHGGP